MDTLRVTTGRHDWRRAAGSGTASSSRWLIGMATATRRLQLTAMGRLHDTREWRHAPAARARTTTGTAARLPPAYRSHSYVVDDWRSHRLYAPPRGYQWVQAGGDYMLVAIATGIITAILLNQ